MLNKPTGQYEIDWTHPLARELLFFATPTRGSFVNLVSDKNSEIEKLPTNTANIEADRLITGSSGKVVFDVGSVTGQQNLTFATECNLFSENNGANYVFGADDFSWLLAYVDASNLFQANFDGSSNHASTTSTLSLNVQNKIMAVKTGDSFNSNGHWFINEVKEATTLGDTVTTTSDLSTEITIGDRSSGSRWWDGSIDYIAIWSRDLTDSEAISFQQDPYQFLKPVKTIQQLAYSALFVDVGTSITGIPQLLTLLESIASITIEGGLRSLRTVINENNTMLKALNNITEQDKDDIAAKTVVAGNLESIEIEVSDIRDAHYNKRDRDTNTNIIELYERDGTTIKKQFQSDAEYNLVDPL